ncbi:hypothetical protein SASPL_143841 [Salvia splendens]|uniref:Uncharacterized protein n=1 Tax=Salvia splendens TaxID=180675 RepID=A0A8X8WMX9_SALSN|nr:hypothetical protein SASPL_143841 [Salvia splendens]
MWTKFWSCDTDIFQYTLCGPRYGVNLDAGEIWKKVLGPVFIYLNSGSDNNPKTL